MAGSLNEHCIIGNVGAEPEIRTMQNGGRVANLSVACTESWKGKDGERKEKTEWIRVVILNDALVGVVEKYVNKGSKVYIKGKIETRSWEQDGQKKYITETIVRPYGGEIILLDSKKSNPQETDQAGFAPVDDFDDEFPPF